MKSNKQYIQLLGQGLAQMAIDFTLEPSPEAGEELLTKSEQFFAKVMRTGDKELMHVAHALHNNNQRLVTWMHKGI